MFRRSTSPQPQVPPTTSTSSSANITTTESNKPLNDWKRRFQQKTKLKLGLTSDLKDNVTGNLESRIERYRTVTSKVFELKSQSEQFCTKLRIFLSIENDMINFLPETGISRVYEELNGHHMNYAIEMMLVNDIETPINALCNKIDDIEQLLKMRTNELLMDYQHHMRKLESLQEKSSHKVEEMKSRQVKVDAAAERLKEGNHFLEAHLKAYEFAYVRLKRRVANVIYAINYFMSQTMANSLASTSEVTPEIRASLDQIHSIQISQEERRVVSVNASHDAAEVLHTASGQSTHHHQNHQHQHQHQHHQPQHRQSSSLSALPTGKSHSSSNSSALKYIRSTSSLLRSSTESSWNESSTQQHDQLPNESSDDNRGSHHCQSEDDFQYALNLHMGVLGDVFGRSIHDYPSTSSDEHPVPDIVLDCLLFLHHNSLSVEGIFRISGDEDNIADLRRSYDEGKSHSDLRTRHSTSVTESHDIASLIKLYFRLLPEPLFPRKSYRFLIETSQLPELEYLNQMRHFFHPSPLPSTLPSSQPDEEHLSIVNLKIFSYLTYVLHEITRHTEENKMTGDNLAIIFAPSLLCPEGHQELGLFELQPGIAIMKRLFLHSNEIFQSLWQQYPLESTK